MTVKKDSARTLGCPVWTPPGTFFTLCALLGLGLGIWGCGGKGSGGGNNNGVIHCETEDQCPPDWICEGNICVPADGGQPDVLTLVPVIHVVPTELNFGSPLLGVEEVRVFEISNEGEADLTVQRIEVIEPGDLKEFSTDPEGIVDITIPPGSTVQVPVTLVSTDAQLDSGQVRITSNDPATPEVLVQLISEYKGIPNLEACVFSSDATPPYPEHPFSECETDNNGDPILDFGLVYFQQPAHRVLAIYNTAEGNHPLSITDVSVANISGEAATYTISLFSQDPDTGNSTPVVLPAYLSAGDQTTPPDVLYIRVDFDASVNPFPTDQLVIHSNDPDAGQTYIDIIGVVSGCPQDYWDVNGDPNDGCEYHCVFQQTTEDCLTQGVDDNCDGLTDNEDSVNCVVYYNDADGDGFGNPNDFHCLCAPEGTHDVTDNSDCDDSNQYRNPNAQESCLTQYDDNCNGSANDPGAQQCQVYYRDDDNDNFGQTNDFQCLCQAEGSYRATVGGDCDDDPAQCGAACNPNMNEDCATQYDDNCNGQNNELNAPNCTTYYRDLDQDGYGNASFSQCWCAPHNEYSSTEPTDCDDNPMLCGNQCYPTNTEVCDNQDNDCDGQPDSVEFNFNTNTQHCGGCNIACVNPHGSVSCLNGLCNPTCDPGYGNCDGDPNNGCETDLNTVTLCGSCNFDSQCPQGFFCNPSNQCEKKWPNGTPCNRPGECQTGFCVDGYCCNTTCTGYCRACNIAGVQGACTFYQAGTDPENDCTAEAQSSCGRTGECNSTGGCALWPSGTVCQAQSCVGSVRYNQDTCDGAGNCQDGGTTPCSPYLCSGNDCAGSCNLNSDCLNGYYCDSGTCRALKPNGQPCVNNFECVSANCVDNFCCNSACGGLCRACDVGGSEGVCTMYSAGTDPDVECGTCRVCNGTGACANAAPNTDPKGDCQPPQDQSTCGRTGVCSGAGACELWAFGTICVPQSCAGNIRQNADICNGVGACTDQFTWNCSPYRCDGAGFDCLSSCGSDTDCVTNYWCDPFTQCVSKKGNGNTCNGNNECLSGFCVDGYCCNTLCGGTCEACNLSGLTGTCSPMANNVDPEDECGLCRVCNGARACKNAGSATDPKDECDPEAQSTCGRTGDCDGSGACELHPSGTICVAQTCVGSLQYNADTCDGTGNCDDSGTTDCGNYVCENNACRTNCTLHTHCISGYYCSGNVCVPESGTGQPCTDPNQCASHKCVDNYCCDTDCNGVCEACNVPGSLGICTPQQAGSDPDVECPACQVCTGAGACTFAAPGTDPKNNCSQEQPSTCGRTGNCDGAGGCALWPDGTICVPQSCTGSTQTNADTCDGAGVCEDGGTTPCSPYVCSGASCLGTCTTNSDCVGGYYCAGGTCTLKKPNGTSCVNNFECETDFCVDNYCCNSLCNGTCQACDVGGSLGICTNFPNNTDPDVECGTCRVCNGSAACVNAGTGTDPKGECAQEDVSTCGQTGNCSGSGTCALYAFGAVCVPQSCAGSTLVRADICNGSGMCVDQGTAPCSPYMCAADGINCMTDCDDDVQCVNGYYCNLTANECQLKKPTGNTCDGSNECTSDFCVDGYCCDSLCNGTCEACDISGHLGECLPIDADTDPDDECGLCGVCDGAAACKDANEDTDPKDDCGQEGQSTCQKTGDCDGAGACKLWPIGTVCVAQSCVDAVQYNPDTCDGVGNCQDGGVTDCDPFTCLGASCRTECSLNSHCVAGYYCDSGACLPKKPTGQPCTQNGECASNYCVDDVCCDGPCSGACRACNLAGSEGTCTNHAANTDPESECLLLCQVCDGAGACDFAAAGTDPKNQCGQDASTSCQQTGNCDGAGACALWPAGTVCVSQSCSVSTLSPADTCDGAGNCQDSGTQSCDPYMCSGDSCRMNCTLNSHCVSGYYCSGGLCVEEKVDGLICQYNYECQSGNCVDGRCCASACAGTCQACNLAGNEGTCTNHAANTDPEGECGTCRVCGGASSCVNVPSGQDPLNQCDQEPESECGQTGNCNGSGACRLWPLGTICQPVSCAGAVQQNADTCDGWGSCVDNGQTNCSPYVCGSSSCLTSCTQHTDCVSTHYCTAPVCVPKKGNGNTCSIGDECTSGICKDGYCCNNPCTGTCQACNVAGQLGICTNHAVNTDPEAECGLCGVCSGSASCQPAAAGTDPKNQCDPDPVSDCDKDGECSGGYACRLYAAGTICEAQHCVGNTQHNNDLCNGSGTCNDGGTVDCGYYICENNACRTDCTLHSHCISGYYCSGNVCVPESGTGQPCTDPAQCASNNCVDGYCCDTSCGGVCEACDVPGSLGTCTQHTPGTDPQNDCTTCKVCNGAGACVNAVAGTDPANDCTQDLVSTCDQDGMCDGNGACRLYASGTVCDAQHCVGNTQHNDDTCNGSGTCQDGSTTDCGGFICENNACRSTCSLHSHCIPGYYCEGGACLPEKANGLDCDFNYECASGICIDNVCCATACNGTCQACDVGGSEGTCVNFADNTDPEDECTTCRVCNGAAACRDASVDTDPMGDCQPPQAASTCGRTGVCNGAAACELWPFGTICVAQSCTGSTLTLADKCTGGGVCFDYGTASCSPYVCAADLINCLNSCTSDDDCVSGYYCNGSQCQQKKTDGEGCSSGNQCLSGICKDTVCCDLPCNGTCESCNLPGKAGDCTPYTAGTDPETECPSCEVCNGGNGCTPVPAGNDPKNDCGEDLVSTCDQTGECDGNSGCQLYPSGTICDPLHCSGAILHYDDTCNGLGTCNEGGQHDCTPYICEGTACRINCADSTHCAGGYTCQSSECCNSLATDSGDACGGGTLFSRTHSSTAWTRTFIGRLVPSGDQNWYKFQVTQDGSRNLSIYVWFTVNVGQEFEFLINKSAVGTTNCTGITSECSGSAWVCYQSTVTCVPPQGGSCDGSGTGDNSRTFYIGVRRKSGATATCNEYTLNVQIGGGTPSAAGCAF